MWLSFTHVGLILIYGCDIMEAIEIVAGIKYTYNFEARGVKTHQLYTCSLSVVSRPWAEGESVQDFKCKPLYLRKAVRTRVLKKKENFLGALLQETIQKQRDEVRKALMKFSYFHSWPEQKIHQCCVHSNIICYEENEIIRVKDDANVYVTHFILEGKVSVIQRLLVCKYKKKTDPGNYYYKLCKNQDQNIKTNPKIESIYMQICHLLKGATFGLGEELSKHTIIASRNTKCLLVPRHIILQHYSLDNIWQKIILSLDTVYPSKEEIFEQFILGRKWKKYSEDMYKNLLGKSRPTNLCIHDVPLTCRASDTMLSKFYKKAEKSPLYLIGDRDISVSLLDVLENAEEENKPEQS